MVSIAGLLLIALLAPPADRSVTTMSTTYSALPPDDHRFRPQEQWQEAFQDTHGPFLYGGNFYAVLPNMLTGKVEVLKSANQGATWAPVDEGNGPAQYPNSAAPQANGAYLENPSVDKSAAGDRVWVAYTNPDGYLHLTYFDLATETWSDTDIVGPQRYPGGSAPNDYQMRMSPNGTVALVYNNGSGQQFITTYQ